MALKNDDVMGLTNLISDAYINSFNTPTFQKAIYFDKADYILTASGNKVSKNSILCGMKNIHMLGKSIIKSEAVLRGDLSDLYFGKYVIIGSKTLICPCFINEDTAENDENELSSDRYLRKSNTKSVNTKEDESDKHNRETKEKEEEEKEEEEKEEEEKEEKKEETDTEKERDREREREREKKKEKDEKEKKCSSESFQIYSKKNNENYSNTNTNTTTILKKKEEANKKSECSYLTVTIGDNVYIGNGCVVKAAFIGNNVRIGDNCVIGERVIIKDNVIMSDNTVVPNDIIIAPFSKYSGCPARLEKELPEAAEIFLRDFSYMHYKRFLSKGK